MVDQKINSEDTFAVIEKKSSSIVKLIDFKTRVLSFASFAKGDLYLSPAY